MFKKSYIWNEIFEQTQRSKEPLERPYVPKVDAVKSPRRGRGVGEEVPVVQGSRSRSRHFIISVDKTSFFLFWSSYVLIVRESPRTRKHGRIVWKCVRSLFHFYRLDLYIYAIIKKRKSLETRPTRENRRIEWKCNLSLKRGNWQ